ncbi:MAG: hypothetical protein PVI23_01480 [Maricaulaceae bacterium]
MTPAQLRDFFDQNHMAQFLTSTAGVARPVEMTNLSGAFPEEGALHRVRLENGEYVAERVLENDYPSRIRYQLYGMTAPGAFIIKYGIGEFAFLDAGRGRATFSWTYRLRPKAIFFRPIVALAAKEHFGPFMEAGVEAMTQAATPVLAHA